MANDEMPQVMDAAALVDLHHHHVVGQLSDDVGKQPGRHDAAALLEHLRLHAHGDAGLQVVAGQLQPHAGADTDSLQHFQRAFGTDGAGSQADGLTENRFFTGKFHLGIPPLFLSLRERKKIQVVTVAVVKSYVENCREAW